MLIFQSPAAHSSNCRARSERVPSVPQLQKLIQHIEEPETRRAALLEFICAVWINFASTDSYKSVVAVYEEETEREAAEDKRRSCTWASWLYTSSHSSVWVCVSVCVCLCCLCSLNIIDECACSWILISICVFVLGRSGKTVQRDIWFVKINNLRKGQMFFRKCVFFWTIL